MTQNTQVKKVGHASRCPLRAVFAAKSIAAVLALPTLLVAPLAFPHPAQAEQASSVERVPGAPAAVAAAAAAPSISAAEEDTFYDTSSLHPSVPGEVLRKQAVSYSTVLGDLNFAVPHRVNRIMYTTQDATGTLVATSGYVVEPVVAWDGPGPRPTLVVGRGTVGQGDKCAPSRNWPLGGKPDPLAGRTVNLEGVYDWLFASKGVRVVVADYIGMGTPGVHTYMNRDDQAHAMLDAARAARNFVEAAGEVFGDVAFYGHSQGGGASAAAAEAAADYAPDVPLVGAYSSAPPADLERVQKKIDGSRLSGAIGFTINGLLVRYPELQKSIDNYMNDAGKKALESIKNMCTNEIVESFGQTKTSSWTKDGRTLDQLLGEIPGAKKAMADQKIGTMTPTVPVMIVANPADDTVDYSQSKQLARDWCAQGAPVVFKDDILPKIDGYNHLLQAASGGAFGQGFILDRFRHIPLGPTCEIGDQRQDMVRGAAQAGSGLATKSATVGSVAAQLGAGRMPGGSLANK